VYTVQVPGDATPGTYTLTEGTLEYYIGANGSYVEDVAVDNEVEAVGIPPGPVGGTAYPPNKLPMLGTLDRSWRSHHNWDNLIGAKTPQRYEIEDLIVVAEFITTP
jgi:hypothetical protein